MHRVVITGGPGAGKTTLLGELARLGYGAVQESARAIIAERLKRGETPRPEPSAFAHEILRRDIEKFEGAAGCLGWVFFDRSVVESLGMVSQAASLHEEQLQAMLLKYTFNRNVFVLPPWAAIYTNDAERDQTFAESVRVHAAVVAWYGECGYIVHEVPHNSVEQRAKYVLGVLGKSAA